LDTKAKILVVDDEKIIRKLLGATLTKNGYDIEFASNGYEAIAKIKSEQFDLILLDVTMPGLDGFETCRRIITIDPELPVIQVTSSTDNESLTKGFEAGALDYIRKPWQTMELLARVKNILRIKAAEKEKQIYFKTLQDDMITASVIMKMILPEWIFLDSNMLFVSDYVPSNHVGGDVFNSVKLSDHQYIAYLGDISGHGVQAALFMSAVRTTINLLIDEHKDDFDIVTLMTKLNSTLSKDLFKSTDSYFTLIFGIIDIEEKTFEYVNCGHPPFIEYNVKNNEIVIHDEKGTIPIGWKANYVFDESEVGKIDLTMDKIIFLYTDGLNESIDPKGDEFGINGLTNILKKELNDVNTVTLPFKIKQHLLDNKYKLSSDDFTLFAFQLQGPTDVDKLKEDPDKVKKMVFWVKAVMKDVGSISQHCEKLILAWTENTTLSAKVEIIVDELLNNIIEHGYKFEETARIVFEFKLIGSKLYITMWDKGIEWIPETVKYSQDNPYLFEKDLFDVSGRGLYMVLSWSQEFYRNRYSEELNETIVVLDMNR
jgi:serine phosphatase RsbU (regulator of sigma subunit)/anti-sigma regulatory factor (Ser/Thr protein kinase)